MAPRKVFIVVFLLYVLAVVFSAALSIDAVNIQSPFETPMELEKTIAFAALRDNLAYSGAYGSITAGRHTDYRWDMPFHSAFAIRALQIQYGANSTEMGDIYSQYEYVVTKQLSSSFGPSIDIRWYPKFNLDNTAPPSSWLTHRLDGLASRTLIRLDKAFWDISRGLIEQTRRNQWMPDGTKPGLKWELSFLKDNWSTICLDIWGVTNGVHFYSVNMARKAMINAARLCYLLNYKDEAYAYLQTATSISEFLQTRMISPDNQYIIPTVNISTGVDKNHTDSSIALGLLMGQIDDLSSLTNILNNNVRAHATTLGCSNGNAMRLNKKFLNDIMPFLTHNDNEELYVGEDEKCALLRTWIKATNSLSTLQPIMEPSFNSTVTLRTLYRFVNNSRKAVKFNDDLINTHYTGILQRFHTDTEASPSTNFQISEAIARLIGTFNTYKKMWSFEPSDTTMVAEILRVSVDSKKCTQSTADTILTKVSAGPWSFTTNDITPTDCIMGGLRMYSYTLANSVHQKIGFPYNHSTRINGITAVANEYDHFTLAYASIVSWYTTQVKKL